MRYLVRNVIVTVSSVEVVADGVDQAIELARARFDNIHGSDVHTVEVDNDLSVEELECSLCGDADEACRECQTRAGR